MSMGNEADRRSLRNTDMIMNRNVEMVLAGMENNRFGNKKTLISFKENDKATRE